MIPKKNNLPPPSNDNKYLDGRGLRTLLTYIKNWVNKRIDEEITKRLGQQTPPEPPMSDWQRWWCDEDGNEIC